MKSLNADDTSIQVMTAFSSSSSHYVEFRVPPSSRVSVSDIKASLSAIAMLGDGDTQKQLRHQEQQVSSDAESVEGRKSLNLEASANGISNPSPSSLPFPPHNSILHHCKSNNDHLKCSGGGGGGGFGMTRSHTLQSLSASSTSSSNDSSIGLLQDNITLASSASPYSSIRGGAGENMFTTFGMDIRRYTSGSPQVPVFEKGMRQMLEPHMRKARLMRERARNRTYLNVHNSIASSMGVPYVGLRSERPFLYDVHTHPIHEVLAKTLGVNDLSKIHELEDGNVDLDHLFSPLKSQKGRRSFHESYDTFVTSFCIPLLHSMAMSKNLLPVASNTSLLSHSSYHSVLSNPDFDSEASRISYRYQAFPSIRVVRPGDASEGPQCDTAMGHSIGFLRFHIPLTPAFGTNALYTESHPGKEDWHPLKTKSVGLGFLFDGGRCINFNLENTTDSTLVALDFCIAIYCDGNNISDMYSNSEDEYLDGDSLCSRRALEDQFSLAGPGFYDEAVIDVRMGSPLWQVVAKKRCDGRSSDHPRLLDPDERVGFPFS